MAEALGSTWWTRRPGQPSRSEGDPLGAGGASAAASQAPETLPPVPPLTSTAGVSGRSKSEALPPAAPRTVPPRGGYPQGPFGGARLYSQFGMMAPDAAMPAPTPPAASPARVPFSPPLAPPQAFGTSTRPGRAYPAALPFPSAVVPATRAGSPAHPRLAVAQLPTPGRPPCVPGLAAAQEGSASADAPSRTPTAVHVFQARGRPGSPSIGRGSAESPTAAGSFSRQGSAAGARVSSFTDLVPFR